MGYWGKLIGGMAGLVMGGPFGAVMGAALGHAADQGALPRMPQGMGMNPSRLASMLGGKDQIFAIGVVVLSATRGDRRIQAPLPHPARQCPRRGPPVRPSAR